MEEDASREDQNETTGIAMTATQGAQSSITEDPDWIKASEVRRTLMRSHHNPADIENMLALYLRHGDLRAKASAMWKSDERFTGDAWKKKPDLVDSGPVPQRYWRMEKAISEDRQQWRVSVSRFLATTRLKPRRRFMMEGVRFYLPDLKRLQPQIFGPSETKPKRGRPEDGSKRDAAWLYVMAIILERTSGKVELEGSIEWLKREAEALVADREHGETSPYMIRAAAPQAYKLLERMKKLV
ncbi:hypothetical protein QP166_05095 [Sphingomonas sp. LR60]|uniref:hypothetical protein n=1 Tax=Sphingomonas sp. LR60 TaxID=3050233 RepID=UPI002FE3EF58